MLCSTQNTDEIFQHPYVFEINQNGAAPLLYDNFSIVTSFNISKHQILVILIPNQTSTLTEENWLKLIYNNLGIWREKMKKK